MSGKNGESTGNERRKGRMEEAERDSRDREKNRLTSLHLIGSSCNHRGKKKQNKTQKPRKEKNRRQMIESRARQEKTDTRQQDTERRENSATEVSSQR